jgi:fumarate hydratase subunit beta
VAYLPFLFAAGVKGIIAKGELHGAIVAAFAEHGAVYLAAIGGLGALLGKHVESARVVAFGELGPEALHEFTVRDFPAVVIIDRHGGNFHETARARWRR